MLPIETSGGSSNVSLHYWYQKKKRFLRRFREHIPNASAKRSRMRYATDWNGRCNPRNVSLRSVLRRRAFSVADFQGKNKPQNETVCRVYRLGRAAHPQTFHRELFSKRRFARRFRGQLAKSRVKGNRMYAVRMLPVWDEWCIVKRFAASFVR